MSLERTHNCGELRLENEQEMVQLSGWVHKRRNLGSLVFLDLRDLYGKTQLLFDPQKTPSLLPLLEKIRLEWVISIKGKVQKRKEGNPTLSTGDIEVVISDLQILSEAKTPPFQIFEEESVNEDLRLKFRFLDIRKGSIAKNLILRHKAMQSLRASLSSLQFYEIQTPILGKTTPEGARDYLVPSRVYPKTFYALPQSPQIFKQLLMISGMDRYFQIATCFRDEDLRADRQPEFTQIDIEKSFGNPETFFPMIEKILQKLFVDTIAEDLPLPFPRMSHKEALASYGTDKPDTRFKMELINVSKILAEEEVDFIQELFQKGGSAKAILVKNGSTKSRKDIDSLIKVVQPLGLKTLTWIKVKDPISSNAGKILSPKTLEALLEKTEAKEGDLILIGMEKNPSLNQAMDHLRRHIAKKDGLIDENKKAFLWVTDFPLFGQDPSSGEILSEHHPFTSPHLDDLDRLEKDPLNVRSLAYDLVLNGYEIGSGSQRIHDTDLQKKIFSLLNLGEKELQEKFGFFLNALDYGTPPHLGIALGLDRIMMILCGSENIRDVIAFPKTQNAADLMLQSPSHANPEHLKELSITHKT